MTAPLNHPMIMSEPLTLRAELVLLLSALDTGLYPPDGRTDEEISWAQEKQAIVSAGVAEVDATRTDQAALRAYLGTHAKLIRLNRYGVASGRFASGRGPVPIFAATVAARNGSAL